MGFKKSLEEGSQGEKIVLAALATIGLIGAINTQQRMYQWDVEFPYKNEIVTAEVKYDLYAAKSGNIAIEYHNPKTDKPSGISCTTARIWFHVLPGPIIYTNTVDKLREYIVNRTEDKHIKRGGDGNAALKLYKLENIIDAGLFEINEINGLQVLERLLG